MNTTQKAILLDLFHKNAKAKATGKFKEAEEIEAEIGGRLFDIIVDDEGLMKEDPKPSAFDKDEKPLLCGSLLLCHNDQETGRETALTNEDITLLLSKIVQVDRPGKPEEKPYKALLGLKM